MGLIFWDGVLRGGTAVLLLLLAWNFGRDRKRSLTAHLGLLLTVSALCYLFLPALPPEANGAWWRVPPHLLGMASPALFWLFAASWFDDDFEVRPWHWAVVAACVAVGAASVYIGMARGNWPRWLMALCWPAPSFVMTALGIAAALRGRGNDLVESRRRVRLALALAIAALIIVIVLAEVVTDWPPPPKWRLVNSVALLLTTLTIAVSVFGWRDPALLAAPVRPAAVATPDADDSVLLARLAAEMTRERLYRQDGLTITAVAARLGVPEYRLRRAINQGLGARNFNAYLNSFRLREVEAALVDPTQAGVPILTMAIDAGFGSLAPFNRAFRDANGCTPTEYRARGAPR